MVTGTPRQFVVAAAAVGCCVLLAACGAERGEASGDRSIGSTRTAASVVEALSDSGEGAGETNDTSSTTETTQPDPAAESQPIADSAVPLTTVAEMVETAPATGEETTTVAPPASDSQATSTSAAPAPTEASVPTLEVVGGEQSAASRVPDGQAWAPFASFAEVTLVHPSIRVERIGFHESNHDGARQLEPLATAISPIVLESRERDTGSRTAADIVVEPGTEIRAPVNGTVLRAGGYVLYCDHQDDFLVIEPDSHPGWEVKLLHINGVMVSAGDRVEAGVTVVAPEATVLPFDSQVDRFTATPPWPHVHIELVDPSIPDRPSTGSGC